MSPDKMLSKIENGFERIRSPFEEFFQSQKVSGFILLACTVAALIIANTDFLAIYQKLLHTHAGVFVHEWKFELDFMHWVNEAVLSLFFFVIGLEIKRELLAGELREFKRSSLVLFAAAGGMLFPAFLYTLINWQSGFSHGWGIPMATDTAFAISILSLAGRRIPQAVFPMLIGIAIIDDLGAVIVIAAFYTPSIDFFYLEWAILLVMLVICINVLGIRHPIPYIALGVLLWFAIYYSGVHATIAGVLMAFSTPARPKMNTNRLIIRIKNLLKNLRARNQHDLVLQDHSQHQLLSELKLTTDQATTPLQRWNDSLERPVALLVLPLFALFNSGITVNTQMISNSIQHPIFFGIVFGLVIGKCAGIFLSSWLAVRLGIASLPQGLTWHHIAALGCIAGIGFTMSVFIASLAFDADHLEMAKLSIMTGSLLSGIVGLTWFYRARPVHSSASRINS